MGMAAPDLTKSHCLLDVIIYIYMYMHGLDLIKSQIYIKEYKIYISLSIVEVMHHRLIHISSHGEP